MRKLWFWRKNKRRDLAMVEMVRALALLQARIKNLEAGHNGLIDAVEKLARTPHQLEWNEKERAWKREAV